MIIVKLIGGLGNQLFQYALGRHLSIINRTDLRLDVSGFENYKLHAYSLSNFNIQENFASKKDLYKYLPKSDKKFDKLVFRIKKSWQPSHSHIIKEPSFNFCADILKTGDNNYLDGYWQSEKYFKDIEPLIRKEFTLKTPLKEKDKEIANQIIDKCSISIHIRRQDYITNITTSKAYNTCGMDYYLKAVEYLANKFKNKNNIHFFVFSDDHEWVKKNLILKYPASYIDHNNADKNYEDLRLMSLCKHNIITNSTFSWWAAWLNSNPEKIVIAPKKWFNDTSVDTIDLIPKNWRQL